MVCFVTEINSETAPSLSVQATLPKHMVTNPIYEQIDGLYDVTMHYSNIMPLTVMNDTLTPNGQIPSSNLQLHNNGPSSPPPISSLSVSAILGDIENDDYVKMSALTCKDIDKPHSTSPRYTDTLANTVSGDCITDV